MIRIRSQPYAGVRLPPPESASPTAAVDTPNGTDGDEAVTDMGRHSQNLFIYGPVAASNMSYTRLHM